MAFFFHRLRIGAGITDFFYNWGGDGLALAPEVEHSLKMPYIRRWSLQFDASGTFFLKEAARHGVPAIT
ncbi:uncharacterized protein B0H18DRAFT_1038658 [Fomitopsis serialis]|uniref:uncharacterized protein n=1 Tax=Fomitopsis serialis TaxID=139415 RepID=UPI0020086BCA|nr:uncharacterized protein B0H18DRAFT_1038658 [Neoantrodia serialis]KAH9916335.1 hypothetical protein B0H18DRAFT_1038658 [Neoantrodia serialis]